MSIDIAYFERDDKIQFTCPNNKCPIRRSLIENLETAGIEFEDRGADIWVNSNEFTSIEDIEQRALAGFKERKNTRGMYSDSLGKEMTFLYSPILRQDHKGEYGSLREAGIVAKTKDEEKKLQSQMQVLETNSKDLLTALYESLRASIRP